MEQVIFLHANEDSEEALSQIQHSLAQRLVLVAPAHMDRLHLSLLLRLARRYTIAQARSLCLVSEDHLAQMLATRMGFATASTLDEYRGLKPGPLSARKPAHRSTTRLSASRPPIEASDAPGPLWREAAPSALWGQPPAVHRERPNANLERLLEDGYLPNPAATPDLEEEEERAEREEHERLHYEIADENHPSQAEQEAEQHEARIIARIRKTSQPGALEPPPATPASPPDWEQRGPSSGQTTDARTPPEDLPPEPPAGGALTVPQPPANEAPQGNSQSEKRDSNLRSMRTIDELFLERGGGVIFEWFERSAAASAAAIAGHTSLISAAAPASEPLPRSGRGTEVTALTVAQTRLALPEEAAHQPGQISQRFKPERQRNRWQLRPPGAAGWRRIGVIGVLALSLLMLGTGLTLVPSAEVRYQEEITPYSEAFLLDIRPGASQQQVDARQSAAVPAEVARFDGVLTAQALATGQRPAPGAPDHVVAFPTQTDVDQLVSSLQAQLQPWGEQVLRAQADQGDILGPVIAETETLATPPAGTSLSAGVASFQVSLALHLRATLIHHQKLLQAIQNQLRQDVSRHKPGFVPQPGQSPALTILSVEPAGPGAAQLELLVRAQASVTIGPALTPDQVRSAIAGLAVSDAEAYLNRQPGVTNLSIDVQPKWLNRLPFFSARITINLERSGGK
jgi:hypothetical protein